MRRSPVVALLGMVLAFSSLALDSPAHAAAPPIDTSYCRHEEQDQCLDFPDFALDDLPELTVGEVVTFTGSGASMPGLSGGETNIGGGFYPLHYDGDGPPFSGRFVGHAREDGTWRVTMTIPGFSQEDLDRWSGVVVWFYVDGMTGDTWRRHEIIYPVTIKPARASTTGWYQVGSSWHWADDDGAPHQGWRRIGDSWYFFDKATTAMATGWVADGGSWYYLTGSGAMATGWVADGGSWYYLTGSGAMATGWVRDGGSWYYLTGSGAMVTGWVRVDGHWSLFAPNGVWQYDG